MAISKTTKRWIWIAAILVVGLIILTIVKRSAGDELRVTTQKAELRTIAETVIANGKIQPETEVIISSEVSGKILELPFKDGAKVKQGDLLVKINPDLAQAARDKAVAALNNARANKASAEARLLQAKAQFTNNKAIRKRNQTLLDQGAISPAEFDNVEASFETADAEVQAAEQSVKAATYSIESASASVKEASDSYDRTTIYAPMDGTISSLSVEVGEQVVGAMQMTGTEIMRVANLEVMEVLAEVNESDIVRVAFGDTAEVEVDAYIDRKFTGVVTEIANSAKSTGLSADQITNFEVKIRIVRASYDDLAGGELSPFRPGMNATVDIRTEKKSGVLSIPIECVTTRLDTASGKERSTVERMVGKTDTDDKDPITVVFSVDGELATARAVETGIQDDMYIEILSGLKEGENVVSGPYDLVSKQLQAGDKVTVVSKDNLYDKD